MYLKTNFLKKNRENENDSSFISFSSNEDKYPLKP